MKMGRELHRILYFGVTVDNSFDRVSIDSYFCSVDSQKFIISLSIACALVTNTNIDAKTHFPYDRNSTASTADVTTQYGSKCFTDTVCSIFGMAVGISVPGLQKSQPLFLYWRKLELHKVKMSPPNVEDL